MADSVRAEGYRATTVADVVRIARTSRRTFYEHFEDRDDCFVALFEEVAGIGAARVAAAVDPAGPWQAQVDAAVSAYVQHALSEATLMKSFVDELASVGPRGVAAHQRADDAFAALLVELVEAGRAATPGLMALSRDVALLLVAGTSELLTRAVDDRRDVRTLQPVVAAVIKAILAPR
jgi:AcrR family transcriptional regulator